MDFLELLNIGSIVGAHRGASSIAPENTMKALEAAVGHSDFIEIDVQLSCDGAAVVIHDDTLERTTDLKQPKRVSELTLKELNDLDYGSWFDGKPEPLLTLDETLKFIKEKKLFLNIEIKDMHEYFSDERVVSEVLEEIRKWGVEAQILISSFKKEYLLLSKEMEPEIPTALLVEYAHPENLVEYLKSLNVNVYNISDKLADPNIIKELREAGFFVNVYTVDSQSRQRELFKIGVNGVFSNLLS